MYVIERDNPDGHLFKKCSKLEQPKHKLFKKLYCVYCGCKAYTVGKTRLSLTGDFYNGEIQQCPVGKKSFKKSKKKNKMKRTSFKMVRTKTTKMVRTK